MGEGGGRGSWYCMYMYTSIVTVMMVIYLMISEKTDILLLELEY